jgi:hypothetical protein
MIRVAYSIGTGNERKKSRVAIKSRRNIPKGIALAYPVSEPFGRNGYRYIKGTNRHL